MATKKGLRIIERFDTAELMTLDRYLKKKRLTQQEFADMLGVAQSLVSDWTLGKRVPRPAMMARIAELTGGRVKPADFYPLENAA